MTVKYEVEFLGHKRLMSEIKPGDPPRRITDWSTPEGQYIIIGCAPDDSKGLVYTVPSVIIDSTGIKVDLDHATEKIEIFPGQTYQREITIERGEKVKLHITHTPD